MKNKQNSNEIENKPNIVETHKDKSKLQYLNSLEIQRENKPEPDNRPKFFITFPYPYMNGKLHLGHLYSISKSDFMAYFRELQDFNVLFPLSFHCTGMPICAAAKKLKDELDGKPDSTMSTTSILEGLGFSDVKPFTDPVHWIRTFPSYCKVSLEHFSSNIDWRRSFITTEINKYYDSFVKWQFYRLRELGHLSFGKRYSIYCPIDGQPCLDHDRSKGEGVKPIQVWLSKIKTAKGNLLVKYKPFISPNKLIANKNKKMVHFEYENESFYIESEYFNNLKYQVKGINEIGTVLIADFIINCKFNDKPISVEFVDKELIVLKGIESEDSLYKEEISRVKDLEDNKDCKMVHTDNFVCVFVPEDTVISRSGGLCVVSLMDQWFIDYSDVKWKEKVKICIDKMICEGDTRSKLLEGVDWIYKWGFSRSFGLGTRVPWDNQYLIESLSDSTIYMALYTFKHFLFGDFEGKDEIFPSNKLSNNVWDFIFYGRELEEELNPYREILTNCRNSFNYFYPVDLRVSGKDLIKNHLLFFIFNHVAIFEEKHWPKRIFTNGHLMLNSEKMSKSTGNFLTVDSCLDKYGVSATRMCLAVCGDTNEDANFVESNANSFILKIYSFVKNIEEHFEKNEESLFVEKLKIEQTDFFKIEQTDSFIDNYLIEYYSLCVEETLKAYEGMKYSDVVKYGFFEMNHLRETYSILNGTNFSLISLVFKSMAQLLYPIMPSLCRHIIQKYFDGEFNIPQSETVSRDHYNAIEHLKTISKRIVTNKLKKNNQSVDILVSVSWPLWKVEVMKVVDSLRCEEIGKDQIASLLSVSKEILINNGIPIKKGNLFVVDYFNNPTNYHPKFDEFVVLSKFKNYIKDNTGMNVNVTRDDQGEPLNPLFKFY